MRKFIFISILASIVVSTTIAQRRINPVEQPSHTAIPTAPKIIKDKDGNIVKKRLITVQSDSGFVDSTVVILDTVSRKMIYPLWDNITVGVNIWDPVMRMFGQQYGGGDVSVELSMFNRFFPTVEVGIGMANSTPDDGNFTYKSKAALYGKIGASYNFLYNKTPDYKFLVGFRLAYSSFKYDITDIDVGSGYWDEKEQFDILGQKSHAFWGEFLLGLKVKIVKNFSMGWSFRYLYLFNYKKNYNSNPGYIPGFGLRKNSVTGSFSLFYTFQLPGKKTKTNKALNNGVETKSDKLPVPTVTGSD